MTYMHDYDYELTILSFKDKKKPLMFSVGLIQSFLHECRKLFEADDQQVNNTETRFVSLTDDHTTG